MDAMKAILVADTTVQAQYGGTVRILFGDRKIAAGQCPCITLEPFTSAEVWVATDEQKGMDFTVRVKGYLEVIYNKDQQVVGKAGSRGIADLSDDILDAFHADFSLTGTCDWITNTTASFDASAHPVRSVEMDITAIIKYFRADQRS